MDIHKCLCGAFSLVKWKTNIIQNAHFRGEIGFNLIFMKYVHGTRFAQHTI